MRTELVQGSEPVEIAGGIAEHGVVVAVAPAAVVADIAIVLLCGGLAVEAAAENAGVGDNAEAVEQPLFAPGGKIARIAAPAALADVGVVIQQEAQAALRRQPLFRVGVAEGLLGQPVVGHRDQQLLRFAAVGDVDLIQLIDGDFFRLLVRHRQAASLSCCGVK